MLSCAGGVMHIHTINHPIPHACLPSMRSPLHPLHVLTYCVVWYGVNHS